MAPKSPSEDALAHVLDNVFVLSKDSGLRQALQKGGFKKIQSVLTMSNAILSTLTYKGKDANGKPADLPVLPSEQGLINALKGFVAYSEAHMGRPLTPDDWLAVTEELFDEYQGSSHLIFFDPSKPSAGLPPTVSAALQTTVGQVAPEVLAFKRGIKRDQSLFPTYKEEKDWDDWQRRTRAQATAQGVENVLDPNYVPVLPQDIELFKEQNKYMMAVFNTCVQTDFGKTLIRKFEGTHNAQMLFSELEQHAKTSTSAILTASELLSYITTATLGRNTWNGTTTSFVLHWEEQVRLYERYVPIQSHLGTELKRTLLQNAVNGITDLRQVKLNADQLVQASNTGLSYQQYRDLLLNACARYDAEWQSRGTQRAPNPRRTVYMTDVGSPSDDMPSFGFDTPVTTVAAFRARMTGAQWHKLDSDSQRIWDSLSDAAKEIILSNHSPGTRPGRPNRPGPRGPGGRPGRPPDRRQVHAHESYPDDDVGADTHDVDHDPPDGDDVPDDDPTPSDDHYLAMATNRSRPSKPSSPAALHHMMSSSRARGETATSKPAPKSQRDDTRVVNNARLINTCVITYAVSKHHQREFGDSLVDRGANGGLAGTDMRVIETSAHRSVHVEGIDNHQVRDVPIVTAGGVINTTRGDVIGIFHQYAHINKGASIHSSVQLEAYKQDVNDRSRRVPGGLQRILTVDWYEIPLSFRNGLPYLPIKPFTDREYATLPHVIMTSDQDWDPSVLDSPVDDTGPSTAGGDVPNIHDNFNQYGEYMDRYVVTMADISDDILEERLLPSYLMFRHEQHVPVPTDTTAPLAQPRTVSKVEPDFVSLMPFFAYIGDLI